MNKTMLKDFFFNNCEYNKELFKDFDLSEFKLFIEVNNDNIKGGIYIINECIDPSLLEKINNVLNYYNAKAMINLSCYKSFSKSDALNYFKIKTLGEADLLYNSLNLDTKKRIISKETCLFLSNRFPHKFKIGDDDFLKIIDDSNLAHRQHLAYLNIVIFLNWCLNNTDEDFKLTDEAYETLDLKFLQ